MKLSANPDGGWQAVAVFEVESDAAVAVDAFVVQFDDDVDRTSTCKLVRAADAPRGYCWFEALLDFGSGEWRAIRRASALISGLERARLPGYRLLAGREWIGVAAMQRQHEAEAMTR